MYYENNDLDGLGTTTDGGSDDFWAGVGIAVAINLVSNWIFWKLLKG